jgi:repressor of nif and glnA expression
MARFRRTKKQTAIMEIIINVHELGSKISIEALQEALPYGKEVTTQAIRSSLRYLEVHGFIEADRKRLRTYYGPTKKAYDYFRTSL